MKTKILLLLLLLLNLSYLTEAQAVRTADSLLILSKRDQQALKNLPLLRLPEQYKGDKAPVLPPVLDNSTLAFFRPVFIQGAASCGQAASIGYALSYEINRLRGLSSNSDTTQYPPYFAWNWENGGNGWYGVSYLHSFDVLKSVGTPNIETFGGFFGPYGEDEQYFGRYWMSGYDKYYKAMKNRLQESYRIDVSTIEGIRTLKYWLYNHLDGSTYGGVANFYSSPPSYYDYLPEGTPEAGKHVTTYWGNPTHAMTICGYNDSIRWDYNGDGLYTNNIDINGDGQINLKDWEIGGFKFANSWGTDNGDDGFHYMTYRSCADSILINNSIKNGIWNSEVHVQYVKENAEPKLTAKITLKHNYREKIRVRMGYSQDMEAVEPDYVISFPIFNFQGSSWHMQGGNTEEDKTIEFGLDITPLMNMIPNGADARFFLLVDEDDPENEGEGEIVSFSLLDYTGDVQEIVCSQSDIPIENGTTILWVDHTVEYDDVHITTDVLKGAIAGQDYYYQIEAEGGTKPYFFSFDKSYEEQSASQEFIPIDEYPYIEPLVVQELEFEFPFYGKNYQQLSVSEKGFVFFDDYIEDEYSHFYQLFQENKIIAPFVLSSEYDTLINDGMWYQGNSDSAVFRWKAHILDEPTSHLNFSLSLFENGEIHFSYGENTFDNVPWIAGISSGLNKIYQFTRNSSFPYIEENYLCRLTPIQSLDSLQISNTGLISGIFKEEYMDKNVTIKVRDASNLCSNKTLFFSSDPCKLLQVSGFEIANFDKNEKLKYGDTVKISTKIINLGTANASDVQLSCYCASPFIEFLESDIQAGNFLAGEEKFFEEAISFVISKNIPEHYRFKINTILKTNDNILWQREYLYDAFYPSTKSYYFDVLDTTDYSLSPGETADIRIYMENIGFIPVENINITASSYSNDLTLNTNQGFIDTINVKETKSILLNVSVNENTEEGSVVPISLFVENDKGYKEFLSTPIAIGKVTEDFETGSFDQYNWTPYHNNDTNWYVSSEAPFEGGYSAKTTGSNFRYLILNENFLSTGNVEFMYYLNADLAFLIKIGNTQLPCTEIGTWTHAGIPIYRGQHKVIWIGLSVDSLEFAMLDNISFPPTGATNPEWTFFPLQIQDTLVPEKYFIDTLTLYNTGEGIIHFSTIVIDSLKQEVDWIQVSPSYGTIREGDSLDTQISIDAQNINMGNSKATLRIFDHLGNIQDIPLRFTLRELKRNACNDFEIASFPNPFRDKIRIDFMIKQEQNIEIQIFDLQGNIIKSAYLGRKKAGAHYLYWNGENNEGTQVPSGVYFLEISSEKYNCTQKIVKIQ